MKTIYWPGTRIVRSTNNGFTLGYTGVPIDWKPLERSANLRRANTAKVDRVRAAGTARSAIHGLRKKADDRLATRHVVVTPGRRGAKQARPR